MAINPSISPPNVQVYEVQQTQTPIIANPTLNPFVVGPAKEIVKAFNADGSLNSAAKQGIYTQLPLVLSQLSFPSPRNNISEVTVETDTIRVFNSFSGATTELPINPGSAFYRAWNFATRAVVRTPQNANYTISGKTVVISIDNPLRLNTAVDTIITFSGTDPLTPQQVADQMNLAFGKTLVTVVTLTGELNPRLQILSSTYGARSSITVRSGGSANSTLGLAMTNEDRVEASGFRGQEDNLGNDTLTPWIEWYRGSYFSAGTAASFPVGEQYGLMDENGVYVNGVAAALAFDSTGINIKVGDQFYADGVLVNAGEVSKVEVSRIKIGTVNTTLSTYDANGKLVTVVRDPTTVRLLTDPVPFAPRYAYFRAQYLGSTSLATAATLTGSNAGIAATSGAIASTTAPTAPFSLGGLTLKVTVIKNDIVLPEVSFTFSGGPFATMNDVVTAIGSNIANVVATNASGKLVLSTVLTGKNQAIILAATSTANSALNFSTLSDTVGIGTDVTFAATKPALVTSGNAFNLTLAAADTLSIDISTDSGATFPTTKTHTSAGATYANIGALVSALQGDAGFVGTDLTISALGNELVITSTASGSATVIRVASSSTAIGAGKIRYTSLQLAQGTDGLNGLSFKWKLNSRSKIYQTTFTSNSLIDAIASINEAVSVPVSYPNTGTENKLMFISTLKGAASKVEVISDSLTLQAVRALGFVSTNDVALGTGRPLPDAYLDIAGNLIIGADIIRNPVTGDPYDPTVSSLYVQYRGLRKDVTAMRKVDPALLELSDMDTLNTELGPITAENPLALAMYFAMLNAPNTVIKALGVDEISAVYPEGTPEAYQRAIDFSSNFEIYAMAPLSQEEEVHRMFQTHVVNFALPENENSQRERRVYIAPKFPSRAVDKLIASGLASNTPVATVNQINLDVNPASSLLAAGINPALPIAYSDQVTLRVVINGITKNYSVAQVNGVAISLRTTFASGENTDSYYEVTPLTTVVVNAAWSMVIRGAVLTIPGSNLPDTRRIAETVNEYAQTYKHRRVSYIFADAVTASLDGLTQEIKSYYAASAYVGVNAYQRPQQPLSNFAIVGFNGALRTKGFFKDKELNIIQGGGVMILQNDKAGLPIYARKQLTTDVSSVEAQEDSILRARDTVSLLVRSRVKAFLGSRNITADLYADLGTLLDAIKAFLISELGALADFRVLSLKPNPNRKDGVILELGITPLYPVNEIKVYIYL